MSNKVKLINLYFYIIIPNQKPIFYKNKGKNILICRIDSQTQSYIVTPDSHYDKNKSFQLRDTCGLIF